MSDNNELNDMNPNQLSMTGEGFENGLNGELAESADEAFWEPTDRELYLSKTTVDHIDLSEAKYIDIKPGYSAIIAFISKGDDTWYDSKTRIYYQFRYDGVDYVASSSNYFGTSYTRN